MNTPLERVTPNSSFRKQEAKPVERATAHQVLCLSYKLKGEEAKFVRRLGNQMMDDDRRNHETLEALKHALKMIGPHSLNPDAEGYAMIETAIAKLEALKTLEGEK